MIYTDGQKAKAVTYAFEKNNTEFVQAEIKRVQDFQYMYPMSIAISFISFLLAIGVLYFVKNTQWHAIAIALILFGGAFAVIDYFSKERANIYYMRLLDHQKSLDNGTI